MSWGPGPLRVLLPILPACGFPEGLWPGEETSGSSSAPAVIVPILGPHVSLGSGEAACLMLSGNGHPKELSKGLLLPVLAQTPDPGKGGSTPAGDDSSPLPLLLAALLSAHPQCRSPCPLSFSPPCSYTLWGTCRNKHEARKAPGGRISAWAASRALLPRAGPLPSPISYCPGAEADLGLSPQCSSSRKAGLRGCRMATHLRGGTLLKIKHRA